MADDKGAAMSQKGVTALNQIRPEILAFNISSKYDPVSNRCFIYVYERRREKNGEVENRSLYDGQVDDLLASARDEFGKKTGVIFDPAVGRPPAWGPVGWHQAVEYIGEMMDDHANKPRPSNR